MTKTLDSGHTLKLFKSIYASNNTFGYLKQYLVAVLSLIDPFQPLTFEHLSDVYTSQVNQIKFLLSSKQLPCLCLGPLKGFLS